MLEMKACASHWQNRDKVGSQPQHVAELLESSKTFHDVLSSTHPFELSRANHKLDCFRRKLVDEWNEDEDVDKNSTSGEHLSTAGISLKTS